MRVPPKVLRVAAETETCCRVPEPLLCAGAAGARWRGAVDPVPARHAAARDR